MIGQDESLPDTQKRVEGLIESDVNNNAPRESCCPATRCGERV